MAPERKGGTVERIRSRLQSNVHDCAGFPAIFSRGVLLDVELLDRIDRQDGRGISRDAGAIDDALSRKRLAVKQALDEVGIVFGAQAVRAGGRESSAGITDDTRSQLQKVFVVAAIQGEFVDFFIAECPTQRGRGGV